MPALDASVFSRAKYRYLGIPNSVHQTTALLTFLAGMLCAPTLSRKMGLPSQFSAAKHIGTVLQYSRFHFSGDNISDVFSPYSDSRIESFMIYLASVSVLWPWYTSRMGRGGSIESGKDDSGGGESLDEGALMLETYGIPAQLVDSYRKR